MPTTFNGKAVRLEGSHFFKASHTVKVHGAFPLTIKAGPTPSGETELAFVDGNFVVTVAGVSADNFERLNKAGGTDKGTEFEALFLSTHIGVFDGEDLYRLTYSIYDV